MRAIRIHELGGPEVLRLEELPTPEPARDQIRVRHTAIGVNFADTYRRTGLYPVTPPCGIGNEAAGVVEAVGAGVSAFKVGDRVAYGDTQGAYAEANLVPADRAVKVPDSVPDTIAAAALVKGMTARGLLKTVYKVKPGDVVVWLAAAGGVGQIATQWAKHLGATVIGVVGSDAKVEVARAHGCAHVIVTARENFAERVRALTDGQGAPVVYDSVGKDTLETSIDCLAPFGLLVNFGSASGPPPLVDPMTLMRKGSLYLTRSTLATHLRTPALLRETAADVFDAITQGVVRIDPPRAYKLEDAAQAHRDLEGRQTTGSLVLTP